MTKRRAALSGMKPGISLIAMVIIVTSLCGTAMAQDAGADQSSLRDLCPDRPLKGAAPCTVDAGHFQLEADVFNATLQRTDGVSMDTYLFTNPTLKFGASGRFDVEVNMVPYETIRTHDSQTGQTVKISGVGDLYLRAKYNLFGEGGDGPGLALYPYVKAPTARSGIGDGAWEGGLLMPASFSLPDHWSLALTPEIDVVEDAARNARHAAIASSLGLTKPFGEVTLGAEIWGSGDFDPDGSTAQCSVDFAASWIPADQPNLQLDIGINFGVTHATPGFQPYLGVTRRF